ncbi:MAG: GTP-binding protein, partial [Thermoguttaceae bacterium]
PAGAVQGQLNELQAMVTQLCRHSAGSGHPDLPEELFRVFTELLDSDLSEEVARELVERLRRESRGMKLDDLFLAKARIARMIEAEINVTGPIRLTPGRRRLVALVGPTGVGKTTTIAKLAAHYRLREKRRVGLITVDTYRIAAVEQLRTYADIIDLPMQVVSTPREMREAVQRMDDLDLILLDTAGRSPKDEVRIQELRAFVTEADADEIHLVLSAMTGERTLQQTAERFAAVGTTALILTKLDEASSLGNVLSVLRFSKLPLSYLTNGQNVPDDIESAQAQRLARLILGMEPATVC